MPREKKVLVKDGGFGTQLTRHFKENIDNDPLWSAKANYVDPEAVIQTHLDFLRAGADVILANTYQASIEGYMKNLLLSEENSFQLIKSTVGFAQTARAKYIEEYECIPKERRFGNGEYFIIFRRIQS